MTDQHEDESTKTIRDLAEGASNQIKVSNRIWIGLIVLSIFVILPRSHIEGTNLVPLPFGLPSLEVTHFYVVSTLLLSVFIIAFCVAHAQSMRALNLAHLVIDQIGDRTVADSAMCQRDLFDILVSPSLARVAPLTQLVSDKYKFSPESCRCTKRWRTLTTLHYVILQTISFVVYYCVPGYALGTALNHYLAAAESGGLFSTKNFVSLLAVVAFLALLQMFIFAVMYVVKVIKRYFITL